MPCFSPLRGYRCKFPNSSGKFSIVFKPGPTAYMPQDIPCGQCIGCRLGKSREWALRCVHEASLYDDNCFITLTYRPEDLPVDGSLVKWHFQDFMKRLRRKFEPRCIRFYMCGEYGEQLSRPHYHACLFNFDFEDKVLFSEGDGYSVFTSQILEDVWTFGFCTVGEMNFETAAYCARYCCKKITGQDAYEHYMVFNTLTGQCWRVAPEFTLMSRRPGVGRDWYDKFGDEVFPWDEVFMRGAVVKPPRYYSKLFELDDPEGYLEVKRKRNDFFVEHEADCTPQRLKEREVVKRAQVAQLSRSIEEI